MNRSTGAQQAAALLGALMLLAGCSAGSEGEGQPPTGASGAQATKPATDDPTRDWVSAVSPGRGAPVELKFALRERPQVGRPVGLNIAVLPVSDLDRVTATFQAGPGLQLRGGQAMDAVERPPTGRPLTHLVTIVPERDGIFFVSAVVLADTAGVSVARTFSIPVIAGDGQAQVPDASKAPKAASNKTP